MAQHAGNGNYDSPYHYNAKEVDPETGYHYYGARYYNSNLSVWLSVDPLADKYPSLSAFAMVANNPVMLIDPNGMEIDPAILDKSNPNYNSEDARAFWEFARSKEGISFLKDYASEGQTIAAVTYHAQGKYDRENIDLKIQSRVDMDNTTEGTTKYTPPGENSSRHLLTISLNSNSTSYLDTKNNGSIFSKAATIVHESYIHVDRYAIDILQDGIQDHSNIPELYKKGNRPESYHHWTERFETKTGIPTRYSTSGVNFLYKLNSRLGVGLDVQGISDEMWNFRN